MHPWSLTDYLIVALMGVVLGVAELISRYRDEPGRVLFTQPALLYLLLNALAPVTALALISAFGWTFGTDPTKDPIASRWTILLVAGLASSTLFRSSLFVVRIGSEDVGVGPSTILRALLDATDRAVDRQRGKARSLVVSQVMGKVSFEKAIEPLPALCFSLMQNLSQEEQTRFGQQIIALANSKMPDEVKSSLLGLALLNLVGEDVLISAVTQLGPRIEREGAASIPKR